MVRERQVARVVNVVSRAHDGNPKLVVAELLSSMELESCDRMASTGRKLRSLLSLSTISEPLAVEHAVAFIKDRYPQMKAVVSAGGETFMVYKLDREGRIGEVYSGNKCASGTGEFFLQQIRRMDVGIDDAVRYARSEKPYRVSGRCSVFCKSDCTHATNKGVPKGQVVAGLCRMMANKVLELLKNIPKQDIVVVGGTTRNDVMMEYLREEVDGLSIPKEATYFEAMGAALWALENETEPVDLTHPFKEEYSQFEYHPPLGDFEQRVTFNEMARGKAEDGNRCILGLDVGSTTTKAVIVRESDRRILASEYLRTNGDPVGASRRCYRALREQLFQSTGRKRTAPHLKAQPEKQRGGRCENGEQDPAGPTKTGTSRDRGSLSQPRLQLPLQPRDELRVRLHRPPGAAQESLEVPIENL